MFGHSKKPLCQREHLKQLIIMTVQCAILRVTYLWGQFLQVEGHCGDTMLLAGSVAMLCIGANEMSNIRGRRLWTAAHTSGCDYMELLLLLFSSRTICRWRLFLSCVFFWVDKIIEKEKRINSSLQLRKTSMSGYRTVSIGLKNHSKLKSSTRCQFSRSRWAAEAAKKQQK